MQRFLLGAVFLVAIGAPLLGSDVSITLRGTVVVDNYGAGPYAAAVLGDPLVVRFNVGLPGSVVVPGQRTDYDLGLVSFGISIYAPVSGALVGPTQLTLLNNSPLDGMRLSAPLDNGDALRMDFDALQDLFDSSDLAQLGGAYDLAAAATGDDFTLSGPGGLLRMRVEALVIEAPQVLQIEILGTILTNTYTNGVFAGGLSGDPATLAFQVQAPGFDLVTGQLTNYAVDPASLVFDVGGPTGIDFAAPAWLQVQDNFPISDGLRLTEGQLSSGESFSFEIGTLESFFSSNKIAELLGSYDLAASLTSFSYLVQDVGGLLEILPETLRIRLPSIGTNYCSTNPNSTGLHGQLQASGSSAAIDADLTLTASQLPDGQFAYFLASRTQGFIAGPNGSQGNLCVLGNIARFNRPGEVGAVATGSFSLTLPLGDFPEPPAFGVTVLAGDTWNFQCWHRDLLNGVPTSNFTDALEVLFR